MCTYVMAYLQNGEGRGNDDDQCRREEGRVAGTNYRVPTVRKGAGGPSFSETSNVIRY
jgi:hypothetical protein